MIHRKTYFRQISGWVKSSFVRLSSLIFQHVTLRLCIFSIHLLFPVSCRQVVCILLWQAIFSQASFFCSAWITLICLHWSPFLNYFNYWNISCFFFWRGWNRLYFCSVACHLFQNKIALVGHNSNDSACLVHNF